MHNKIATIYHINAHVASVVLREEKKETVDLFCARGPPRKPFQFWDLLFTLKRTLLKKTTW